MLSFFMDAITSGDPSGGPDADIKLQSVPVNVEASQQHHQDQIKSDL